MILITGGLGFVGANTARALLDVGEDCILAQRHTEQIPEFINGQVGKRVFIESLDVMDLASLTTLGQKYPITGIIHLATGGMPAGTTPLDLAADIQATITGIANIFQVAVARGVRRVSIAGAPLIYNGVLDRPWHEDQPLPLTAAFPIEAAKKCAEIVSSYIGLHAHVEAIQLRLPAMYGPHYDPSRGSLVGRVVHAAVKGTRPDLDNIRGSMYADDGGDQCYIKDAAHAVALLQTAEQLNHRVYNIGSGRPTTNQAIVDAVKRIKPGFQMDLPPGHQPGSPEVAWYLDIRQLCDDIGFVPEFDIQAGVADYIAWLQAGNEK